MDAMNPLPCALFALIYFVTNHKKALHMAFDECAVVSGACFTGLVLYLLFALRYYARIKATSLMESLKAHPRPGAVSTALSRPLWKGDAYGGSPSTLRSCIPPPLRSRFVVLQTLLIG